MTHNHNAVSITVSCKNVAASSALEGVLEQYYIKAFLWFIKHIKGIYGHK